MLRFIFSIASIANYLTPQDHFRCYERMIVQEGHRDHVLVHATRVTDGRLQSGVFCLPDLRKSKGRPIGEFPELHCG